MAVYSASARERAMKIEQVILRALSKQITFWQAAHIARISPRHLRRLYERYRRYGFDGLYYRRKGRPSPKRVPLAVVEQVLCLYREKYFDFSVRHFHEKLREEHGIDYSYTWVKRLLQEAGLVAQTRKRGPHRRKRERRPLAGMLLHIDASKHRWLGGEQRHDLLVILDDATSEIYYAQLVEEESTPTALAALREVGGAARYLLCFVHRSRQPFLADAERRRDRGPAATDAGGPGHARSRHRNDSGVFTASAWAQRTELRHLAGPAAARVAGARDHHPGGSQPFLAGELHCRAEPQVFGARRATGKRIRSCQRQGSGSHLLGAAGARGESGQHRARGQPHAADRENKMARHAGQRSRAGMRTLGWHLERVLRTAPGGPLCPGRLALSGPRINFPR